jgi:Icc-related predicted phosphoesterase
MIRFLFRGNAPHNPADGKPNDLKIFFATDIHGSEVCFHKFLNAARIYKANVIILAGDLCGKAIVPIIQVGGANYKVRWRNQERLEDDGTIVALESEIRSHGLYPVRMSAGDTQRVATGDAGVLANIFREAITSSLRGWIDLADRRLDALDVRCYINPGNDDPEYVEKLLSRSSLLGKAVKVENPDGRVVDIGGGFQMLTLGYSNETPFKTPRELTESELRDRIWDLSQAVKDFNRAIFNIHVPPIHSGLDWAPSVNNDLSVRTRGGQPELKPVGSTAVREAILHFQPLLGLHGHLHESKGHVVLGKTLCLNPGSDYNDGILTGALVTLGRNRAVNYQFVSG